MDAIRLYIPKSTAEITAPQLRFISGLFLQGYPETEFFTKAFLFLSGLKLYRKQENEAVFKHKSVKEPFVLSDFVLTEFVNKCRFLVEPGEFNPIKWINLRRARHYRLYNATLEEYLMAENYWFAYTETKKGEHLVNLTSVLYRAPWQKWDPEKIQSRARSFTGTSPETLNSVFMWYSGFRWYVTQRCKTLFSGKPSLRAFNVREYINGMVHQLNNGDITLNEKLLKQPLWFALDELEQRAILAEIM
jgi:hypothetical protein